MHSAVAFLRLSKVINMLCDIDMKTQNYGENNNAKTK
jgi:hypothetical protein